MTPTDALGRPLTPAQRRVERMRRYRVRTTPTSITVPRAELMEHGGLVSHPGLRRWADAMASRAQADGASSWDVETDEHRDPLRQDVTFTATWRARD